MIVGTTVQQMVQTKLSELGLVTELINSISTFAGALSTGFLTVSFLFYIDNDPFGRFFETVYGAKVEYLIGQGVAFKKYCAYLQKVDLKRFEFETDYMFNLSLELSMAKDGTAMNILLKKAVADMGLPLLWGEGSLNDKMNDPNWVLQF